MNIDHNRGNSRKAKKMNAIAKATSLAVPIAPGLALAAGEKGAAG